MLITVNTIVTKPNGVKGVAPGRTAAAVRRPARAVRTSTATPTSRRVPTQGRPARVPACEQRGPQILNVCQLYERAPVVLALFVDAGSCAAVLSDMQALSSLVPGRALRGGRDQERPRGDPPADPLARADALPVGMDKDGALAALYKVATCPQVTFAYPGGEVQSKALLARPSRATLRRRVAELVAASRAKGWRQPAAAREAQVERAAPARARLRAGPDPREEWAGSSRRRPDGARARSSRSSPGCAC